MGTLGQGHFSFDTMTFVTMRTRGQRLGEASPRTKLTLKKPNLWQHTYTTGSSLARNQSYSGALVVNK